MVAGTPAGEAIDFDWELLGGETEATNDSPPSTWGLSVDAGVVLYGTLDSFGWDNTATPDRTAECQGALVDTEYPPLPDGAYSGDVDWFSIEVAEAGVLCVSAELESAEDFSFDLLLYSLDECDQPVALYKDGEDALGFGLAGTSAAYDTPLEAGARVGVLLAGYIPAGTVEEQIAWRLGLGLIRRPDEGGNGICPTVPDPS